MPRALLVLIVVLLAALPARAGELRVGIFVGNDFGRPSDQPLIFASADARKMHDLFLQFGHLAPQDAYLLQNESRRAVEGTFTQIHKRIVDARNTGDHTTLLFYYSGHGTEDALHLGPTELTHDALRNLLEDSGADVRIAMLDACQSGAVVRNKGGTRGPAFAFKVSAVEARGTAFLTSSAASELSQESAEVGGGFFTHYLHSALLGAGDANRDGEVTLPEAYQFVYGETVFGTQNTERTQTPRFDFDLVGAGSIALTQLEDATAKLNLLGDLSGTYSVWDASRRRYVAEVDGSHALQLAVRPGTYYVHKRLPGWVDEARYDVRRGEVRTLALEDFTSVPYEQTASRGELEKQVRRSRLPALSVRGLVGTRGFGPKSEMNASYIPRHGVVGAEFRFHHPASITWWSFDLMAGGGPGTLTFAELGTREVIAQSWSTALTGGIATEPRLFRAGVGGRAELIGFGRTFVDGDIPTQRSFSISPGVRGWLGLHHQRLSVELVNDLGLMATGFTRDGKRPVYSTFLFSVGYRF
ncbi:MAG: caspase family protein [Myxococcales bacterium]|nr:caspase family protein [Myxococcales bacterium]